MDRRAPLVTSRPIFPYLLSIAGAVILCLALLIATAIPAEAHRRASRSGRSGGFDPSDTVLACIRGPWNGMSMESGGNYANGSNPTYKGAYQSDRDFEVDYAVNLIPPAHWHLWKSHTWERADRWHPMIQDEMARNGIRARGLQPWPKPSRVCPRA